QTLHVAGVQIHVEDGRSKRRIVKRLQAFAHIAYDLENDLPRGGGSRSGRTVHRNPFTDFSKDSGAYRNSRTQRNPMLSAFQRSGTACEITAFKRRGSLKEPPRTGCHGSDAVGGGVRSPLKYCSSSPSGVAVSSTNSHTLPTICTV